MGSDEVFQGKKCLERAKYGGNMSGAWANKQMVLTLPARCSFCIIARHKSLGGGFGCVLPVRARVGRTFEALAPLLMTFLVLLGRLSLEIVTC